MSTTSLLAPNFDRAKLVLIPFISWLLGLAFVLIGCGPTSYASFDKRGFRHTEYGYSVMAMFKGQAILPNYWQIDNFYVDERHRPLPKKGADYEVTVYIDYDLDGDVDDIGEFYTYDLRFTHKRNAGVIWLRTVPISVKLREKELRVMAQSYVESAAATYYETVQLEGELYYTSREESFATAILGQMPGSVADREAYAIKFDVANVQQLRLSPGSRKERVLLVLIRTPYRYYKGGVSTGNTVLPVLMIAGYSNMIEDFDKWLGDFQQFVSRIVINGKRGAQFR